MVSAVLWMLLLAAPAWAQETADSSATLEQEQEDAIEGDGGETGLVLEETGAPAPAAREGIAAQGRLRVAGGAFALTGAFTRRNLGLDLMLAREPGEQRLVDDLNARLTWKPRPAWTLALGRVAPEAGLGLVLGAPRSATRAPGARAHAPGSAPLSANPARAASGFTGLWAIASMGPLRAGVLAATTRRDARPVGDALLPLAGVRHRDARGDSARGRLSERVVALALEAGPAWLVVAHARADPHRVPPSGATAAEQRAAPVTRGGAMFEAGARASPAPGAKLEAALAFDAHGRARSALTLELAPPGTGARAALSFESEAAGFAPLRARPEHLPFAHAGLSLRAPLSGTLAWRLEAHAVQRRAFEPVRLWSTLRLTGPRSGWIELRRDADPVRTLFAFRAPVGPYLALFGELRYDRHGLARETWRARAKGPLPAGFEGALELRLGSARSSLSWLDSEVPGGAWVAGGSAAERTRIELGRPGNLSPRLSWIRTRTASGTRSEARFGLQWSTSPSDRSSNEGRPFR